MLKTSRFELALFVVVWRTPKTSFGINIVTCDSAWEKFELDVKRIRIKPLVATQLTKQACIYCTVVSDGNSSTPVTRTPETDLIKKSWRQVISFMQRRLSSIVHTFVDCPTESLHPEPLCAFNIPTPDGFCWQTFGVKSFSKLALVAQAFTDRRYRFWKQARLQTVGFGLETFVTT